MSTRDTPPKVSRAWGISLRQPLGALAVVLGLGFAPFLVWRGLWRGLVATNYLPHRYCYLGKPGLVWTHVVADSLIALAYLAISTTLAYLVYKARRDIPFHWMFLAFGLFIVACGGTHFVEVVTIWVPVYVFSAAVKGFTAVVSVITAIVLPFTVQQVLSLIQDAKASKQVTAKLRISEQRIRAITETATDAIISADSQGRIMYFNPAAEHIFGHTAAEALGRPLTFLMPERFRSPHQEGLNRFLTTRKPHVIGTSVEVEGRRKDGHEVPLSISLSAWEAGGATFFTGILRDITEKKRAEDEILELTRKMAQRNSELVALNAELESFSYSVSHDLRAPLRAIDGFSLALIEDCKDQLSVEGRAYLQRVRTATERMGQLIDDMLKLAHTTRSEVVRAPVDLSTMAREIALHLQKSDPGRRATFVIAPGLVVEGDRRLLRIVLENLLGNAWKFTSKQPDTQIELGVRNDDSKTVYFVQDNGAGFDMRYADKLFGPFQRLHDTSEFPGTGVGLATVQRIMHRHGGRVWAESASGKGATFYFVLESDIGEPVTLKKSAVAYS